MPIFSRSRNRPLSVFQQILTVAERQVPSGQNAGKPGHSAVPDAHLITRSKLHILKLLPIFIGLLLPIHLAGQYAIRGTVRLDSTWERTVYLSLIPDLEDMFRCSEHLIMAKSDIRDDGQFVLRGNIFPERPHLVRIHVNKKGDPPATLVIGGKDENHCFLALDKDSRLQLKPATEGLFDHFSVTQDPRNQALYTIDSLRTYFAAIDTAFSSIAYKNMVQKEQAATLLAFADSCRFLLPALYAVQHADWGINRQELQSARARIAERFSYHPYLQGIIPLPVANNTRPALWGGMLVLLVLIGGVLTLILQRPPAAFKDLSPQERKILYHLHTGKTNKEIAGELHIEPSTVKSHVYSIYQKLNISSRKEVVKFKRWIDGE